jgi:hypothetical protein
MEQYIWVLFIYLAFIFILGSLYFIYKEYLKWKLKYLYLIYWHGLFLVYLYAFYKYSWNIENWYLVKSHSDDLMLAFFILVVPWAFFSIKNYILKKYFRIDINLLTYALLDFLKMIAMIIMIWILLYVIILVYNLWIPINNNR